MPNRDWTGAKWWKFDFHNHTPASDDYGKGSNQAALRKISQQDWLLGYMRAGIDCVAVTDHNTGSWIDPLKNALQELRDEGHDDYRPLYLFPGVELTVQGNIHILAIFPTDRGTSDIDRLLGAVGYRATNGASDGCSERSATEVIDAIVSSGGIAIPAHVDELNGLFTVFTGNTLDQVLSHGDVFAIEVVDPSSIKPAMYIQRNLDWSEVIGTDSHHPSGNVGQRYPGSHFTWVKMSEPSFEGLQLALTDGPLSLKRSDQFSSDPNVHAPLVVEQIVVDQAKYLGRGESFACTLNPWLNTVIGGRGTGKSTAIELLRIALCRRTEIPYALKSELEKYSTTSNTRDDDGLLIKATSITVYLRKDGIRFRVKWVNEGEQYTIEQQETDGTWVTSEGDIAQRFPIRMYSQKQIFELAKQPDALLKVVDDAPDVDYRNWKLEWDELVSQYLSHCAQAREVQSGLQEESVIRGQLADIKQKLEVFETAGHSNVLKSYQLAQNQKKAITAWENSWSNSATQLRTFSSEILPSEIDPQHLTDDQPECQELIRAVDVVRSEFEEIQLAIQQLADRINSARQSWERQKSALTISQQIDSATKQYEELMEKLSEVGTDDPSLYGKLVQQKQSLEERLTSFTEKRQLLSQHQKNAEDTLEAIKSHRQKLTQRRHDFLSQTLADNSYVRINVVPYGHTASLEEEFRALIERASGGFERDIGGGDDDEGLLSEITRPGQEPMEQRVENLKRKVAALHANEETAVSTVRDRRFLAHIQALPPERIDRLRCWFPSDSLEVSYSLKDGENFQSVKQGSPGQKTAALLAFIFSYGSEPLILDQPEDDLDNYLIYDLIVAHLRQIKQQRQVLIVTHNANIVVNGDAENVIALDVRHGQTRIVTQNSLQDRSIRDEICRVMEGGKEAFHQRYRRINAGHNWRQPSTPRRQDRDSDSSGNGKTLVEANTPPLA